MRSTLEEGQIIRGSVTNITDYGLFIDLGGMDGLCHITDLSWGRVSHPSKLYKVGEEIQVKILKYDKNSDRVSLGVKQFKTDPWERVPERYAPWIQDPRQGGFHHRLRRFCRTGGRCRRVGAYLRDELVEKVRAIPPKSSAVGDEIEVQVLNVEAETKRISLGMKQLQPNPWDVVEESYPVGSVIEGKIKNITDFGIFIGIEEGIDGLIHVSDLSWTERIKHPSEKYAKGETIQAVVLKIDKENERFSLGVKQLEPDPWQAAASNYPIGSTVEGTITNVTDFGVFVQLEEGIEGLVHVSEISKEKVKTPVGMFNINDTLQAMVINVSADDRKIGLSVKALQEKDDNNGAVPEEYVQKVQSSGPSTIGDLLKAAAGEDVNK
jgi:small subunit ribosomal protein S1